jgi:hypothetical protein
MANKVIYEWSIETLEDGEIIDSSFYDDLPTDPLEQNQKLVLVRNEGNEGEGLTGRLWAYVVDGKLPEYFEDANGCEVGYKVPKKLLKLINK